MPQSQQEKAIAIAILRKRAEADVESNLGTKKFQDLKRTVDDFSPIQKGNFATRSIRSVPKGNFNFTNKLILQKLGFSKPEVNDAILNAKIHGIFFDKFGERIR